MAWREKHCPECNVHDQSISPRYKALRRSGDPLERIRPAAGELMTTVPPSSQTVTDWYKQSVYDPNNTKIGEIMDVLVAPDGKINSLIVGVGGFLGAGEKDVAVNLGAIKKTTKNNSTYLTMNTNKEDLKSAPGFKYDREKTTWVPDTSSK